MCELPCCHWFLLRAEGHSVGCCQECWVDQGGPFCSEKMSGTIGVVCKSFTAQLLQQAHKLFKLHFKVTVVSMNVAMFSLPGICYTHSEKGCGYAEISIKTDPVFFKVKVMLPTLISDINCVNAHSPSLGTAIPSSCIAAAPGTSQGGPNAALTLHPMWRLLGIIILWWCKGN